MSILSDFRDKAEVLDFCDLAYVPMPKQGNGYTREGKRRTDRQIPKLIQKCVVDGGLCSNKKLYENVVKSTMLVSKYPDVLLAFELEGRWPDSARFGAVHRGHEDLTRKIDKWFQEAGYISSCEYYSHKLIDESMGFFWIHSTLPEGELKEKMSQNWVLQHLDLIHYYFSSKYPDRTNPHLLNGFFKRKTIQVLKLTAQGLSSKEISEHLYITPRGVNYHVDRAKEKLGATNKAELISLAKKHLLL
ncbi:helix-turn-helix transcriptional regulator [Ferrimonas sp. YFM]|uniref:helix-turn-helix transcriptional regulator n=1 Tax=Ferrimonas sp. YFM TaxID=3028878 RepID=UPI0025723DB3|nr:helix-turn-helix transcriptional regulator [Ferrimonas sp. YFM]BDY05315.1 hypothetical protein F0521_23560 [Ferrimonas sp. YFM]